MRNNLVYHSPPLNFSGFLPVLGRRAKQTTLSRLGPRWLEQISLGAGRRETQENQKQWMKASSVLFHAFWHECVSNVSMSDKGKWGSFSRDLLTWTLSKKPMFLLFVFSPKRACTTCKLAIKVTTVNSSLFNLRCTGFIFLTKQNPRRVNNFWFAI